MVKGGDKNEKLKLTDPNWMFWRVLRRDKVKLADEGQNGENHLSRHPLNLLQGIFLGYHGLYKVLPDGWHNVAAEGFREVYFNQPQPPGFSYARWERVRRPE